MSNELIMMDDLSAMANAVAKSGMMGTKSPEDALTMMLVAQAQGVHPGSVVMEYHIINGKPSLKADAMLGKFQNAGGTVEWLQLTNEVVEAKFSHPKSPNCPPIKWTLEDAKRAELTTGKNAHTWKKYPRSMLRSRVVSEGIRTVFPAVIAGVYTPEETDEFQPAPRQPQQPQAPREAECEVVEGITNEQRKLVSDKATELGWTKKQFQNDLGIDSTAEITVENWDDIKSKLTIVEGV